MAFLANLRSTIAYQTTGSTISTGAIYTTLAGNVPAWSNQLTYSTLTGSTISTNSIAAASTLTGSSIILSGNMGIGKTAPATVLDITGTLSVNNGVGAPSSPGNFQGLQLSYVGSGASGYGQIVAINPGSTYTSLCLNPFSQGNVGIGTTNPGALLHIYGSNPTLLLQTSTAGYGNGSATIQFITSTASYPLAQIKAIDMGISPTVYRGDLVFYSQYNTTLNEAMRIQNGGNVGIGTASPGYTLDVVGSSSISSTSYVAFRNTGVGLQTTGGDLVNTQISLGGGYGPYIRAVQLNNTYTDGLRLDLCTNLTNNNVTPVPRISILSGVQGGNVGIGTTNPTMPLSVGQYGGMLGGSTFTSAASVNGVSTGLTIPAGTMYLISCATVAGSGISNQQWYNTSLVQYGSGNTSGFVTAILSSNIVILCSSTGVITVNIPAGSGTYTFTINAIRLC